MKVKTSFPTEPLAGLAGHAKPESQEQLESAAEPGGLPACAGHATYWKTVLAKGKTSAGSSAAGSSLEYVGAAQGAHASAETRGPAAGPEAGPAAGPAAGQRWGMEDCSACPVQTFADL